MGPGETVLEIGPGRGALTEGLVRCIEAGGGRLVLVELDDALAAELAQKFDGHPQVRVIHRNVLDLPLSEVTPELRTLKVVGNIPYNLTSPILFHLLRPPRPREILLLLQKEVADRILAEPGSGAFGALTVGVRTVASAERVLRISPEAFRPRPKVDSALVRFTPFEPAPLDRAEEHRLRGLSRSLFQWRRKQLGKILRDHPELQLSREEAERVAAAAGVELTARPETVSPEGFIAMAEALPRQGLSPPGPD